MGAKTLGDPSHKSRYEGDVGGETSITTSCLDLVSVHLGLAGGPTGMIGGPLSAASSWTVVFGVVEGRSEAPGRGALGTWPKWEIMKHSALNLLGGLLSRLSSAKNTGKKNM